MSRSTEAMPRCRSASVTTSCRGAGPRRREVRRAEADRLKSAVDAAVRVVRRPAGGILKQANRADPAIAAQVEPMVRPLRDADQIAAFDLDGEHGAAGRVDVEQAAAFDDQADFVFV